ncbi:MAG TPA: DNA-binding response regulator [Prolixibacteraceae bacterium]|nr:DNA-binding response regulator [Prolixibacteraceae bacterium]
MNVLIIEDESIAADKLEHMIIEIDPSVCILAKIGSVKEAAKWLSQNNSDLIFLDIQLSDGISFSIFDQVIVNTPVIFTTAFDQYAIKAFKLNSIAYLLKPVRKIDLAESLQKYRNLKSAFNIDFDALLAELQGKKPEYKKRFLIQIADKIRKVEVSEVACFYAMEKGCYISTFQGNNYPVDYSLDKLETMLEPDLFFRINRKFIVNMNAITNMVAYSRSRIKLELKPKPGTSDETIVSIERTAEFKKWLNG